VGEGWQVVERLLAGVVVGLAVGLVAAWIGLGVTSVVLGSHRAIEGGPSHRPAPVAPFPRPGGGRFLPVSLSMTWGREGVPRG